jgi:hypothetical protein
MDWLAEDAVSGEPVSAGGFPAICDLQGDFHIMQGGPILTRSNFIMLSMYYMEYSRREEQGEVGRRAAWIANGGREGASKIGAESPARIPRDHVPDMLPVAALECVRY